ncbi:MAG TPA: serine/threonine-protein kinase [Pirellulales bacterium]|nr:serine/threonine-protein kinase [Pirellulales bacterium]
MSSIGSSHRTSLRQNPAEGSSRRGTALPGEAVCDPDQATVISQRPPLSSTPARAASPIELSKQLAGEQLNHFQLLEYVGGGGMGAVFRALDTMLNREVALKVLPRDQGADEETRRRFQNEAQSAARLDHENIARVYYVGEDRGLNYIVFEFIEGVNLRDLVERRGPLPVPEALGYTLQIAHALGHASSRDVVHRDIKPSNLIITDDGRAKLVDMGLARLHQVHANGDDLTASGVTLGTFDYISPEQARDPRSADVRSDIYSLGCTLYYMLTGRPPFPDGTVLQKLLQHNSDAPPDPREFNPTLPPELSALVSKMLAKDPARRYQLPTELIVDLHRLAEQIGCPLPGVDRAVWAPDAPAAPRPSLVRHLPWAVPVAILLLAVGLLDRPWPGLLDPAPGEIRSTSPANDSSPSIDSQGNQPRSTQRQNEPVQSPTDAATPETAIARQDGANSGSDVSEPSIDKRKTASSGPRKASATPPQVANSIGENADENAPSEALIDVIPSSAQSAADRASPLEGRAAIQSQKGRTNPPGDDGPMSDDEQPEPLPPEPLPPEPRRPEPLPPEPLPPEPLPPGLLVVGDGQKGPQRFSQLAEACAVAKNGDSIELRYNGPRDEMPLALADLRLVVRPGPGYRPLVRFRPTDTNPVSHPRGMIKVNGGGLRLANLAIELDLSLAPPSENWSLFELQSVESLWLDGCVLVVRNATNQGGASHDKVSFVRVDASPRADMLMPGAFPAGSPVQITLRDCVARGEAVFAFNPEGQPMGLAWHNGLLATTERFLAVGGSATSESSEAGRVRLDLEQLTVFTRLGFCRIGAADLSLPSPDVEIRSRKCVFASDGAEPALIDQTGVDTVNRLKSKLHWEAVHNLYQGYRTFWKITSLAASAGESEVATFTDWLELWGSRETDARETNWRGRRDLAKRPLHLATMADFDLDEPDRADSRTAPKGPPPGMDATTLPDGRVP